MGLLRLDESITKQKIRPGTLQRIFPYVRRYRAAMALLVGVTALDSGIIAANPLLLGAIIDDAIEPHNFTILIALSLAMIALGLIDAVASYFQIWSSAHVSRGLVFNLRNEVFGHVQQQPLAFFTRSQTGSLVSRLNNDIIGAQQAVTSLLSEAVSTLSTLVLVLTALFYLSWQITTVALITIPFFLYPGKVIGRRLQRLSREGMQLEAEMGSMMNERFNVAGAMLTKLYGRPDGEAGLFAALSARVRDIAVQITIHSRLFTILMSLLAALIGALVYGLGGDLVIHGTIRIGTLVAIAMLISRLYAPINQLTSLQVNFLTALVSFDRVFEVLDLKPLVGQRPGACALPARAAGDVMAPEIEFDQVYFRYPTAAEVSLASLESIALPAPERANRTWTLRNVSFLVPAGKLTALVGPSGAGKTTITHLVPRLYDPNSGVVRIDGHDIRGVTLRSLQDTVGVVTQDPHLFHDTIRANLAFARPQSTEKEMAEACEAALIWDLVSSLPDGLDTVAGDRGYRLSGGEKQRIALARLLLKAPGIVILDEATAHLDSESEMAIQQALKTALAGRTSLVIAHRLSTIRQADQILVVDEGKIRECGTHGELLMVGGLYAELYRTQFAQQPGPSNGRSSRLTESN
jgi:ATP-binding cassette, subfamily B, bacterial